MSLRIEDYALIGNTRTAALVGNNGSIDWLCMPRFDSGACFAALLGSPANGHWIIAPSNAVRTIRRQYRGPTLVLANEFETDTGAVEVVDFMPIAERPLQQAIMSACHIMAIPAMSGIANRMARAPALASTDPDTNWE
jgi:GH15 family glucan-1,4-alpha-glucosidase